MTEDNILHLVGNILIGLCLCVLLWVLVMAGISIFSKSITYTLNSNDWKCTKVHQEYYHHVPVGSGGCIEVCDKYERK